MQRIARNLVRLSKQNKLNYLPSAFFAGGGHHHAVEVHLNRENFVSNENFNNDLVALNGFHDVNDHSHHDLTDPYAHLRNKSFLSFERLYFSDPYYHEDDHEPLMNEPHGYLTNDDPMDVRNNIERPLLDYLFFFSAALAVGFMLGFQGLQLRGQSVELYDSNLTAQLLEDEIRQIRTENDKLVKRRNELLKQLE